MNKKDKATIGLTIIIIIMIFNIPCLLTDYCCFTVESYCYDWANHTEIEHSICGDEQKCRDYCNETGREYVWSACCITDGSPPHCINTQGCYCD